MLYLLYKIEKIDVARQTNMTKTENKSYLQRIILAYMCKYKLIEKQTEQKLGVCDTALTT